MNLAEQVGSEINRVLSKLVGKLATNITIELVNATPVQTGFARSNWIPTIGVPFVGVVGSREGVDYSVQLSAVASLAGYSLDRGNIYITNNVDYIDELNAGTSPEAQAGFVEDVVDRAVENLR